MSEESEAAAGPLDQEEKRPDPPVVAVPVPVVISMTLLKPVFCGDEEHHQDAEARHG